MDVVKPLSKDKYFSLLWTICSAVCFHSPPGKKMGPKMIACSRSWKNGGDSIKRQAAQVALKEWNSSLAKFFIIIWERIFHGDPWT